MVTRDATERQAAFTGLLATPVIARPTHPALWPLVRRHRPVLAEWFGERLGYRLVVADDTARLYRLPMHGAVTAPPRPKAPSRRILVLALLAGAAAEDADDLTNVQELSDRVRALAARDDVPVSAYDPDRFSERQLFVKAIDLLAGLGALRPAGQAGEEMLSGWAHRTDAIGGAYQVERELLLRLIDPASLAVAVGRRDAEPGEHARRHAVMRRLIELPVCLMSDLTDGERAYLTAQRQRLLAWCREMTGWAVEQRAEGLALIPPDESGTDRPFPRMRADHFGALLVLDRLLGRATVDAHDLLAAATDVAGRHPKAMTAAFRDDPAQLADATAVILAELDLLRADGEAWRVMPAAARFRNPKVVLTQQRIEGEE